MKKAIFSGSSHFMGLGLEFELSTRYTFKDWLDKNGVHSKEPYIEEDFLTWKNNRWANLISKKLGVQEWNCCENEIDLGFGLDLDFFDLLLNKKIDVTDVSYIFQEFTLLTRLNHEASVYTSGELLELIEKDKLDDGLKDHVIEWLVNNDSGKSLELWMDKFSKVKNMYPNIKFFIVDWNGLDFHNLQRLIPNNLLLYISKNNKKQYSSFMEGLKKDKLLITDSSYCYTSNERTWDITWWDIHANKEGNIHISDMLFEQINKKLV